VGLPVLVIGSLVAGEIYGTVTGCGSVDPTDPRNYSAIMIMNDTSETVTVDDCRGAYCDVEALPKTLAPGASFADHAACAASGADMTSWRVRNADGRILGYVAVDSPRSQEGLVYHVSLLSPDRRTPSHRR
jgi:hypothetical protein